MLLLIFVLAQAALAAPDEDVLGKAQGYPDCWQIDRGLLAEHCLVGGFSGYDKHIAARKVAKGTTVRPLKRASSEPSIAYDFAGRSGTIESFLQSHRNMGLLVLRGDTILIERYQYDRKPEHRFTSMSMAKTVVAMLVGIALHEGKIVSVDDRADKYVAELKGHPYGEISLRHLLTMSSGMRFGRNETEMLTARTINGKSRGGADTMAAFRTRDAPSGTRFFYANGDSQVLGLVLRAATGKPIADYFSEKVWQPLGAEADATWLVDASGHETGFIGINATLRDWARLGLLLANDGTLDGREIVPAAWVRAMTSADAPHLKVGTATRFNGYGYQTWLIHPSERYFALLGARGQAVFVDPGTKVVVVHTAVYKDLQDVGARGDQFALFYGVIAALR